MNWKTIENEQAFPAVLQESAEKPVLLFKHSHRCSISAVALSRLERSWDLSPEQVSTYQVNVISQRELSRFLADKLNIWHESPQVLLLKDGKCVYNASHLEISYKELTEIIGK
jgi:bacillithiol system protein YtxJ